MKLHNAVYLSLLESVLGICLLMQREQTTPYPLLIDRMRFVIIFFIIGSIAEIDGYNQMHKKFVLET